ncbi:MAG: hypothetical protein Q9219_007500 [cf. Caloplaca sp. 3 TL-2023]
MRFATSSQGLVAIACLSSSAIAINPKHHAFLKRQGCYSVESECSSVGTTLSDCISYVCDSCTSVDPAIPACCELSSNLDIANCIEENIDTSGSSSYETSDYYSSGSTFADDIDSAATSYTGNNFAAATSTSDDYSYTYTSSAYDSATTPFLLTANPECSSVINKFDDCASKTPGFGSAYFWEDQASCICYIGSSYAPSSFDEPYSSCLDVLSSSDYEAYLYLTINSEDAASTPCASLSEAQASTTATSDEGDFSVIAPAGASTNTPATLTPSPGNTPTVRGAGTTPTATTSSSSTTSPSAAAAGNGGGGNVAGSSGVDALGVQILFIGLASFVAILHVL